MTMIDEDNILTQEGIKISDATIRDMTKLFHYG
jgi:hypothetical protein